MKTIANFVRWTGAIALFVLIFGCASPPEGPERAANRAAHPKDPWESVNRSMFRFNEGVDDAILKPAAHVYRAVVPSLVRTGVNNFFGNVGDVWNLANSVLQLKAQNSAETFMRLNVNTLLGLGGLLDIATEMGIERRSEDFGQTLGRWGMPAGPFLVLPLLGPSTLRDTAALPVDYWGNPVTYVADSTARISLSTLGVVQTRTNYLRASQLLEEAALDRYSFTRDAYLQKRRNDVSDGNPPEEDE